MDSTIKVAVVRSDRRRGAVAEALALIGDDLRRCVQPDSTPVVVPNLDHPDRPWMCTHRDTLSAVTDALLGAGAASITIAGGRGRGERSRRNQFDKLGYRAELWGRPAKFLDLDASPDLGNEDPWTTVEWTGPSGEPISLGLCSRVAAARCRVAIGVAKTHAIYRVGLGLTDLTGVYHPDDRFPPGVQPAAGVRFPSLEPAASVLAAWRGGLVRTWLVLRSVSGGLRLTGSERRRLEWVERSTSFLVALAALMKPRVSLIDGFDAMEGDGPRHGRRVNLRTVVAGTDPVAVDAVAAWIMGFEPREIAYLRQAEAIGLGTADLSAIKIVGDPIADSRRRFRRHSADRFLRLVSSTAAKRTVVPRPHFGSVPARSRTDSGVHQN